MVARRGLLALLLALLLCGGCGAELQAVESSSSAAAGIHAVDSCCAPSARWLTREAPSSSTAATAAFDCALCERSDTTRRTWECDMFCSPDAPEPAVWFNSPDQLPALLGRGSADSLLPYAFRQKVRCLACLALQQVVFGSAAWLGTLKASCAHPAVPALAAVRRLWGAAGFALGTMQSA